MKSVICKSGEKGWQCKLHTTFSSFEEFQAYDEIYGNVKRLGFESAEEAWKANPTIQGSTNPSDYRTVKGK